MINMILFNAGAFLTIFRRELVQDLVNSIFGIFFRDRDPLSSGAMMY